MKLLLFILLLLCGLYANCQVQECGTSENSRRLKKQHPELIKIAADFDRKFQQYKQTSSPVLQSPMQDTITVVFHIVYCEAKDSMTEAVIKTQLAILNMDFNAANPDLSKVPSYFKPLIGNMNVKFMLAKTDPNGNPCNGIFYRRTCYTQSSRFDAFMKYDRLGGRNPWDPRRYLNIWVCPLLNLNGFSTVPEQLTSNLEEDGVVINPTAFGVHTWNEPNSNYGRTLTHEVGHWLGLKHTFGDDDTGAEHPECTSDDIDDTPPQALPTFGMHSPSYKTPITCGNGPNGAMWMNYMDYAVHICRWMFTQGQVQRKDFVLSDTRNQLKPARAYLPPVHQQANVPAFTTNSFSCIAVGKDSGIWAGTSLKGLYKLGATRWEKAPVLDNRNINQIVSDRKGGIWIAQAGHEASNATAGGVSFFADTNFSSHISYTKSTGLATRNVFGIYVDTFSHKTRPQVWVSSYPHVQTELNNGNVVQVPREGGLYHGLLDRVETPSPYFDTASDGTNHFFNSVAGNANEIWVVDNETGENFYQCQIRRYDAVTEGPLSSFHTNNTGGVLPPTNDVKAIYIDRGDRKWVGLNFEGIAFADQNNSWQNIFFPDIFPDNSAVNANAIIGDDEGNVFIGTTQGLVMYAAGGDVADVNSYKLFTVADRLPSNNVTALAIDTFLNKLVIATDNGITYWDKDCMWQACPDPAPPIIATTVKNGNWNDPTVWSTGKVPECGTVVVVLNTITVTSDAVCRSLSIAESESAIRLSPGKSFVLCQ